MRLIRTNRLAFSLVELVVVIMILGILAAIAAPRLFKTSATATDNSLKQTLSEIRNAINRYAVDNGGVMPGADEDQETFKNDLQSYLRSDLPENPVGANPSKRNEISMRDEGDPLSTHIDDEEGWIYDIITGEFRANVSATSADGVTPYSAF